MKYEKEMDDFEKYIKTHLDIATSKGMFILVCMITIVILVLQYLVPSYTPIFEDSSVNGLLLSIWIIYILVHLTRYLFIKASGRNKNVY